MKKITLFVITSLLALYSNAQVGITKPIGKNADLFGLGYGLSLAFGIPLNEGSSVIIDADVNIFSQKDDDALGFINIPLKVGYQYRLNHTDKGFYVEPSIGYNVYGLNSYKVLDPTYPYGMFAASYFTIEDKVHGLVISPAIGYIFNIKSTPFNVKAYYESNHFKGGSFSYAGLNLSHPIFGGKKKNKDE